MRMKQTIRILAMLVCTAAAGVYAAPPGGQGGAGQDPQTGRGNDDGAQIIIRSEAEKKRRQQQAAERPAPDESNRQSDPDATRGLERAEQRRAEAADAHSQAPGTAQQQSGWYEYLFGKRQHTEEKSERDWYEYLFGKRRDADQPPQQKNGKPDGDSNGWWPFD